MIIGIYIKGFYSVFRCKVNNFLILEKKKSLSFRDICFKLK